MSDLREEIGQILEAWQEEGQSHIDCTSFPSIAFEIESKVKEHYVEVDSDQSLPRNKMSMASELLYATAEEARQDMLKAGFRRIKE